VKEITLQTPRSVKKEGGGGAQDTGAESLSLKVMMKDHGEAGCPPAVHGGTRWSRYPLAARGRDTTLEQVDA